MLVGITVCSPTRITTCFRRPGCFQGPGCVPLDELFLTAPTGGCIGDPRRLALRKEIAFRSRKPRPCAYASWQTPYLCFYVQSRFQLCSGLRMRSSQRTLASGGVHWGLFRSRKTRPCAYASLQTPYLYFYVQSRLQLCSGLRTPETRPAAPRGHSRYSGLPGALLLFIILGALPLFVILGSTPVVRNTGGAAWGL